MGCNQQFIERKPSKGGEYAIYQSQLSVMNQSDV